MPVQWKIFRIINYLIIIPSALIILALIISTGLQFYTDFAFLSFIFISTCGIIVIVNCIINHLWLERYYPENYPGKAFRNFSTVFFVLMTLVLLLFTGLFITSVYDLFVEVNVVRDWSEYLAFGLSGFIITCGFYLLVYRVKIRRLVRRNQQRLFNNFLETNN